MKTLDKTTRKHLKGEFIEVRDGVVHYEIGGAKNGSWVVLIHGAATPIDLIGNTNKTIHV